eukprot:2417313-Prymnesium_polylepis.1
MPRRQRQQVLPLIAGSNSARGTAYSVHDHLCAHAVRGGRTRVACAAHVRTYSMPALPIR